MIFDRLFRGFIALLLLVTVYLLFTFIQASDRARAEALKLQKKLANPAASPGAENVEKNIGGNFANSGYFSKNALPGGTLGAVLSADPPGLNPLLANEASAQAVFSLCTMFLAERDWQHPEKFEPLLAESWEISPDKKQFRIKLRHGVMWQSFTDPETGKFVPPRPVTAHDVKFTVDVILNKDVNCAALRSYYGDLVKTEVLSDHEILFSWRKEYYGALSATLELFPLPRHFYCPDGVFDGKKFNDDHLRNRMIVGCGPYIFVSWEKSRRITLQKNPDYIGKFFNASPPLEKRIFEIIRLPNTQFQSLLAGKVGMLSLTPEQWVQRTDIPEFTSGKFRKIRYPGNAYTYIGYNQQKKCFADAATRRALTMLIDRKAILKKIMFDCGIVAKGPFAPGSVFSDKNLQPYPYDVEKAKKLLASAGWKDSDNDGILERDGEKFSFTMLQISGSSLQMKILPMIKSYFAAAGIDMRLQVVEWSVLLERLKKREFEACNLGWTGSIDPDPYQIFHSDQIHHNGDNFVSFSNKELDEKIIALRKEFCLEKRKKLCMEIEKIIHEEQPYTFMFYMDALIALDDDFKNVKVFPYGVKPLSFYWKGI